MWTVRLDDGTTDECNVLISAVGFLNTPRYPDWPGLEQFEGPKFHTFRWEHEHDLTDKVVAIVGTGSTSTQIVPVIAPFVDHLYVFQREPGWIIPKGDQDYTEEQRRRFRRPVARRRERIRLYTWLEMANFRRAIHRPGTKVNANLENICRGFIDQTCRSPGPAPGGHADVSLPGKRPIFARSTSAHRNGRTCHSFRRRWPVTRTGVVDAEGVEREIDVLVMATGFQPTNYLASVEVVGRPEALVARDVERRA